MTPYCESCNSKILLTELRPLPAGLRLSELPGLLASLPRLTEVEADEFAEDLAACRSLLRWVPPL